MRLIGGQIRGCPGVALAESWRFAGKFESKFVKLFPANFLLYYVGVYVFLIGVKGLPEPTHTSFSASVVAYAGTSAPGLLACMSLAGNLSHLHTQAHTQGTIK